jgi:hypothetical protein
VTDDNSTQVPSSERGNRREITSAGWLLAIFVVYAILQFVGPILVQKSTSSLIIRDVLFCTAFVLPPLGAVSLLILQCVLKKPFGWIAFNSVLGGLALLALTNWWILTLLEGTV